MRDSTSNKNSVNIRPMKEEDIPRVAEFDRLSFSLPWSDRSFRHDLNQNPASRLWVAECIDESGIPIIVGDIVVWLILDEAHIGTISVHPEYRRQGIGKKMLEWAIDSLKKEGAVCFILEVRKGNIPAQALYQQFGFKVEGVRKGYYQDNGEDALIMVLDIKLKK